MFRWLEALVDWMKRLDGIDEDSSQEDWAALAEAERRGREGVDLQAARRAVKALRAADPSAAD